CATRSIAERTSSTRIGDARWTPSAARIASAYCPQGWTGAQRATRSPGRARSPTSPTASGSPRATARTNWSVANTVAGPVVPVRADGPSASSTSPGAEGRTSGPNVVAMCTPPWVVVNWYTSTGSTFCSDVGASNRSSPPRDSGEAAPQPASAVRLASTVSHATITRTDRTPTSLTVVEP